MVIHLVTDLFDPALGSEFQLAPKALNALMRHGQSAVRLWTCARAGNGSRIALWLAQRGYAERVQVNCVPMARAFGDGHHRRRLDFWLDLLHLYGQVRGAVAQGDIVWKCGQANWLFYLLFMSVCRADAIGPMAGFERPPWRDIDHMSGSLRARYFAYSGIAAAAGWMFRAVRRRRPDLWMLPATSMDWVALAGSAWPRTMLVTEVSLEELTASPSTALPAEPDLQPAVATVLWAGAMVHRKRPLLALEVITRVLAQDVKAKALMLGEGPLHAQLQQRWAALPDKIRSRFRLEAPRTRAALAVQWAGTRVLLVTSLREANSVLVFEAMAHGLTVVSAAVSGMQDSVGACGQLYRPEGHDVVDRAAEAVHRAIANGPPSDPLAWLQALGAREDRALRQMVQGWER